MIDMNASNAARRRPSRNGDFFARMGGTSADEARFHALGERLQELQLRIAERGRGRRDPRPRQG
jgi:hypothetical protein